MKLSQDRRHRNYFSNKQKQKGINNFLSILGLVQATMVNQDKPIIFFDGYCSICNHWVDFMLKRDDQHRLFYASLQGTTAKEQLEEEHLLTIDTIILKVGDHLYFESTAVLRAIALLGGIYKASPIFLLVPPFIRNWFYQLISKNRYRWFGKNDTCRIPTAEEAQQLLP